MEVQQDRHATQANHSTRWALDTNTSQTFETTAYIYSDPSSPTLAYVSLTEADSMLLTGIKTTDGLALGLTDVIIGDSEFSTSSRTTIELNETGMIEEISDPNSGVLKIERFSDGLSRINWSDFSTQEQYEIDFDEVNQESSSSFRIDQKGKVEWRSTARTGSATVSIKCQVPGVEGEPEIVPDAKLTIVRRSTVPAPGLPMSFEQLTTRQISPGVFEYDVPLQGTAPGRFTTDIDSEILKIVGDVCTLNLPISLQRERIADEISKKVPANIASSVRSKVLSLLNKFVLVCRTDLAWDIVREVDKSNVARQSAIVATAFRPPYSSVTTEWSIQAGTTSVAPRDIILGEDGCPALDVAGEWSGSLLQPGFRIPNYTYEMNLAQSNSAVTGTSAIAVAGTPSNFGNFSLIGTLGSSVFTFEETNITSQNPPPGVFWCIKSGDLTYKIVNSQRTLRGPWSASGCLPGTVNLTSPVR